jgi:DNA-binding CsgD family transcriptional regulator
MRALSERDATEVTALVAELGALDEPEPFPAPLVRRFVELARATSGFYIEYDQSGFCSEISWCQGTCMTMDDPESRHADRVWTEFGYQHPVRIYRERTGDWTSTRLVSDFVSRREFERTDLWRELYRESRTWGWIAVSFDPQRELHRKFNFLRSNEDFSERDRLVVDLLRPHLERRLAAVRTTAAAVDALAAVEAENDAGPHDVVLCSTQGAIEFASPRARRLLAQYFDCVNGHLPEILRGQGTVTVVRGDRRLTVRRARTGDVLVVLLAERDARVERLTPRQRTILEHLARGETDAQIAAALGIAPATVGKHLEQIYERLDVHTRTAAAALLYEALTQ